MPQLGAILLVVAALALPSTGSAQSQQRPAPIQMDRRERRRPLRRQDPAGIRQPRPQRLERPRRARRLRGRRDHARTSVPSSSERAARGRGRAAKPRPRSPAAIACCSRPICRSPTSRTCAIAASSCSSRRSRSPSSISATCASGSSALQDEASNFKPYTTRADAPQIPENLALDISRTTASITLYEQTLARTRSDQAALRDSFDDDIARFRELKGG